ncbi:MAG TPA: hypothetical protein DIU07_07645 [Rhodobacteraceae bacterium]|nr:hypothetical protein [Paracoccaceae bacterium]
MSETPHDRRSVARTPGPQAFAVLVDDESFPAVLTDISVAGLQARVDAVTFDEIRERIDGVRFGDMPPLSITLHWGLFDGRFGASFKDDLMARPIVERIIAADGGLSEVAPG